MTKTIDYYFALKSPWSYLGDARLRTIAAEHRAAINHKPFRIGEVFSMSGGLPLAKRALQRQAYRMLELQRWCKKLGVNLTLEPKFFPASNDLSARVVIAAQKTGADVGPMVHAIMRATWAEEKNQADPETLKAIADGLGHNGGDLLDQADTADVQAIYARYTEEAKEFGVFGAPSYVVGGELFWGQDRLDFVADKLAE
ncbi:MAG: 2-hydroxychromene-2-carboxylate isomerase [Rhodospirillaceae bacterium]